MEILELQPSYTDSLPQNLHHKTLLRKARAKFVSNAIAKNLASLNSKLSSSYKNTYQHCCNELHQEGKKLTGHYCNGRWCINCNRIRTAKNINGYMAPLSELENKYFITLTIPNVKAEDLKDTLKTMIFRFKQIQEVMRKRKTPIKGVRKLECTYNKEMNNYHPHFHLIIDAKHGIDVTANNRTQNVYAEEIIKIWLKKFEGADRAGQDQRPADDKTIRELFKYFTKIIGKTGKGKDAKSEIQIKALDTIFCAMEGLRVFQPMGIRKTKEMEEDIDKLQAEIFQDIQDRSESFHWIDQNWISLKTGEFLTFYEPSDNVLKLIGTMDKDKVIGTRTEEESREYVKTYYNLLYPMRLYELFKTENLN